jgi:ABC-type uncharacterized transport system YnjBCD permease subunit
MESINHVLVSCVFAREVWSWSVVLHRVILGVTPPTTESRFNSWWCRVSVALSKEEKGSNSLLVLIAWEIWKRRNACFF